MAKCDFKLCNFINITLRHGCSPVNLLHIFRTSFTKNTSEQLLLVLLILVSEFIIIFIGLQKLVNRNQVMKN